MSDKLPKPGLPYWVPESIPFVEGMLAGIANANVFEWGSGGSTEWLSRRANHVWSVEHDKKWYDRLLALSLDNTSYFHLPLDKSYEDAIRNVRPIIDIVCVDGRRRVRCMLNAVEVLCPKGILLLDNSERKRYKPAIDLMKNWDQWHFNHPDGDWRTSIWRKPK